LIFGQRGEAVADVAGWNDAELTPQASRAAAVVGGRHDADEAIVRQRLVAARGTRIQQRAEPAQHIGKSGAAAERGHSEVGAEGTAFVAR